MIQKRVTLLDVYERHVKAKTSRFTDWCAFVGWVSKHGAKIEVLDKLKELSASAYDEATKPEEPKPKKPKAETAKQEPQAPAEKKGD